MLLKDFVTSKQVQVASTSKGQLLVQYYPGGIGGNSFRYEIKLVRGAEGPPPRSGWASLFNQTWFTFVKEDKAQEKLIEGLQLIQDTTPVVVNEALLQFAGIREAFEQVFTPAQFPRQSQPVIAHVAREDERRRITAIPFNYADHPITLTRILTTHLGAELSYRAEYASLSYDFELVLRMKRPVLASLLPGWTLSDQDQFTLRTRQGVFGVKLYQAFSAMTDGKPIDIAPTLHTHVRRAVDIFFGTADAQQSAPVAPTVERIRLREEVGRQIGQIPFSWPDHPFSLRKVVSTSRGTLHYRGTLSRSHDFELVLDMGEAYDIALLTASWQKTEGYKYIRQVRNADFAEALHHALLVVDSGGRVEVAPGLHRHMKQAVELFFKPDQLVADAKVVQALRERETVLKGDLQTADLSVREYQLRREIARQKVLDLQGEIEKTSSDYARIGHRYDPVADGMLQRVQEAQANLLQAEANLTRALHRRDELQAELDKLKRENPNLI
jgi:hypothetical protein